MTGSLKSTPIQTLEVILDIKLLKGMDEVKRKEILYQEASTVILGRELWTKVQVLQPGELHVTDRVGNLYRREGRYTKWKSRFM